MRNINGRFPLALGFLALAATPLAQAAPADAFLTQIETHHEDQATSLWTGFLDALSGRHVRTGDLVVTVTDTDGHPLAGATVLAGQSAGVPFQGNQAVTGADGSVTFTNAALRGQAVPVTASLDGFTTTSVLDNRDNTVRLALQSNPDERGYGFVRGHLNGIPKLGAGNLEIGFFLPAARPETLLNFNVDSFVSSYTVKVNIYGDRDIPGNVVFPSQTKFWNFVPISISKPDFVMPLPTSTYAHMYGMAGGISISGAVNLVQKKDYLDLVNLFTLSNVGWTRDRVQVHGNDNFDIDANHAVVPNQVSAQIQGIQGFDAVSISLLDPAGDKGDFIAMDMKALKSESLQNGGGTLSLGQVRSRRALDNSYVFTALFDKTQIQHSDARWVVGSVQPAGGRSVVPFTRFLSPIKSPSVAQGNREFHFTSPASNGLEPTLMLFNVVSEKKNDETMGRTRKVIWSAVVQGSADHIVLPNLGRDVLPAPDTSKDEKFHWEVTAIRTGTRSRDGLNLQASLRDLQDVSTLQKAF